MDKMTKDICRQSLTDDIKVACRVQVWKKTFCQNSHKVFYSFIENNIMFMYCIYFIFTKNPLFKVLEYLRTCNIFYLINAPHVTFGIFDWHMLKKGILS